MDTIKPKTILTEHKIMICISDLCLPHLYGSYFGHWKHYLGELDWQKLPGVFAVEYVSEQCSFLWLPNLLVLHHHTQHCCAHLTLCQVRTKFISKMLYNYYENSLYCCSAKV